MTVFNGDEINAFIDTVLAKPDHGEFAGVILVADHKNDIHVHRCVGLADESWGNEHTLDAKFLVGSATKMFTAALVMKLIEEGAGSNKTGKPLSLDGVITDYLDYYSTHNNDEITIHQLLSMRAGVPDYTAMGPAFFRTFNRWPFKTREFVELFCSGNVLFEPGSKYQYSNSNYYILGAVIEELTGKPFGEALEEKILDPLEMNDSGVFDPATIYSKMAVGYNKITNTRCWFNDMSVPFTSGAMYSTAPDFLKWDRSFHTNKVLSAASLEKMFTPWSRSRDLNPRNGCYYFGYGWVIQYMNADPRGEAESDECPEPGSPFPPGWVRLISSWGVLPDGFNSSIIRNPGSGRVVLVFSNHYCERSDTFNIASDITKHLIQNEGEGHSSQPTPSEDGNVLF